MISELSAAVEPSARHNPRRIDERVFPASKFQSDNNIAVHNKAQTILTLSLILLSSKVFRILSTPGYAFIEILSAVGKRNRSLADIRAKLAANRAGIQVKVNAACKEIATGKDAYSHPTRSMPVLIGEITESRILNCGCGLLEDTLVHNLRPVSLALTRRFSACSWRLYLSLSSA